MTNRGAITESTMTQLKELIKRYFIEEANRKLMINVAGNYFVKGGALLISLLVMPAYMKYFDSQATLGMWFTIVQLLNWIMLLDFGIGGGLRNKIIEPLQNGNKHRVTELVSSTYFAVIAIVTVLIIAFCFIVKYIDWYLVLGVQPEDISNDTLIKTIFILGIGVCIRFFSVLVSHVLYAVQRAVMPGVINLFSSALIMLYLIVTEPSGTERDIINLAYVNSIANNLPALIATIWLFSSILKGMWPRISEVRLSTIKEVLGTGGVLFYLQIVMMLLFNVKELYISWFIGAEEVVEYQIYYKLIGMAGGLFTLALNPVWSAVSKALVEKRKSWILGLYKKGLEMMGIFGIIQFFLLIFMPWIVELWLREDAIVVSRNNGMIFCIYNIVYMWMMLNYNFACGMGRTRTSAIWLTIASGVNLLLTMWGSNVYDSWIIVIIATTVATIPCALCVQKDIFKVISNIQIEEKR